MERGLRPWETLEVRAILGATVDQGMQCFDKTMTGLGASVEGTEQTEVG